MSQKNVYEKVLLLLTLLLNISILNWMENNAPRLEADAHGRTNLHRCAILKDPARPEYLKTIPYFCFDAPKECETLLEEVKEDNNPFGDFIPLGLSKTSGLKNNFLP